MPHGGKRAGAGRKSKAEEDKLAELFDAAISIKDRKDILIAVGAKAKRGGVAEAKFLFELRYGQPSKRIELVGDEQKPLQVHTYDYRSAIARIAPRPMEDSGSSGEGEGDSDGAALGEDHDGG